MGRVNFKQDRSSPFLAGASPSHTSRMYSEETARDIDEAVSRIIEETLTRVRKILNDRKAALIALTERLIDIESVDGIELKKIINENSPGPLLVPGTESTANRKIVISDNDSMPGDIARNQ